LGCFVGALLVGLLANYTGFLAPKVAMFSNIGLMVAVLLWRPQGLYPVANRWGCDDAQSPALPRPAAQPLARAGPRRDPARPRVHALPLPRHQGAQRRGQDPRLHRAGRALR